MDPRAYLDRFNNSDFMWELTHRNIVRNIIAYNWSNVRICGGGELSKQQMHRIHVINLQPCINNLYNLINESLYPLSSIDIIHGTLVVDILCWLKGRQTIPYQYRSMLFYWFDVDTIANMGKKITMEWERSWLLKWLLINMNTRTMTKHTTRVRMVKEP